MMTQTAELADGIRLTKRQAQVLEAVVSEHAQTRRAVPIMIVQAYCNARSVVDQDAVLTALARLRRLDLIRVEGEAILPTPGCMDRLTPGAPAEEGEPQPAGDAEAVITAAPMPDLKTCFHCGVTFRRPDAAPIPDDRCERCHGKIDELLGIAGTSEECSDDAEPEVEGDGAGEALPPAEAYPATVERIHPEDGITISAELLDRCAAMHLTLLEEAREAYAQGDEAAGRELQWLIDTGEQLVAAGGAS